MDMSEILSAITLPAEAERWLAYASIAIGALTLVARGLDWMSPRLRAAADRMAIRAATTPGDLDDRAAKILAAASRVAAQVAVMASACVDIMRAIVPRARITVGRHDRREVPREG